MCRRRARPAPRCASACIGARPANFTTVRFSEKLLEHAGISVETLDLSEVFGRIDRTHASDDAVVAKRQAIDALLPTARAVSRKRQCSRWPSWAWLSTSWRLANELDATAIQCWTLHAGETSA